MKKTFKRTLVFMLAMSIMCLAVFTGCRNEQADGVLTKKYFEENTTEVLKRGVNLSSLFGEENPFALLKTDGKSTGVKIDWNLTPFVGFDMGLGIESANDAENGEGSVKLVLSGANDSELDLGIYFDREALYLSSKALTTEDKAYGIKFESIEKIAEKFDSSNLAKILGLPENSAKSFFEENGINDEYIKTVVDAYNKYAEKSQSYTFDKIYDALMSAYEPYYGEISEETVDVNGKAADVLTLSMDANRDMLTCGIDVFADLYSGMLDEQKAFYEAVIPEPLKETYLPMLTSSYGEVLSVFDEMTSAIEDASGIVKISVAKDTGLVVMAQSDVSITSYGETVQVNVTEYIGEDIVYTGTVTENEETLPLSGRLYREDTENGTKWALEMTLGEGENGGESKTLEIGFVTDKNAKTYKLYVRDSESMTDVSAAGTYEITDERLAFGIDSICADGEDTTPIEISVVVDAKSEVSKPEEKEELLTLSEDGVYALIGRISSSVQKLSEMFEEEPVPEVEYHAEAEYAPLSYDDYELYSEYYTYEEFCEFVDVYNMAIAG